jgi:putative redox protein
VVLAIKEDVGSPVEPRTRRGRVRMTGEGEIAAGLHTYYVEVERHDETHAMASSHGHILTLGVRHGDPTAGFKAVETLLAALGVCLTTNVNDLADKMRLQVDSVYVEIEGDRRDKPPRLVQVRYRLLLDSPEPPDKLAKLHALAAQLGTVTNTLLSGVAVQGELAEAQPRPH